MVFLITLIVLTINPLTVYSAEVYYPGQSLDRVSGASQMNPSYSLSERFHDLFDFSSQRTYAERSGRISGNFAEEIGWQNIGGNKSKSFLEEGVDYLTELNLNIQEKLGGNYQFEGQSFLRKTDNRRIETKQELRLKQLNLRVYNPQNLFEFGDFYGDFSPFVLGSSLEGFNIVMSPEGGNKYAAVIARSTRADEAAGRFQRNVLGIKTDYFLFRDSELFSNFRLGAQAVTVQDDSSSTERSANTKDLKNTVMSIDGEISWVKNFSLTYELGYSSYLEDADSETVKDTAYAKAFRLQPALNLGSSSFRYLYYYVQPKFHTDLGSASPDKIQHQLNWDYSLNERVVFSFSENYYWDHLSGSSLTKRTTYDEKYFNFNLKPFLQRKNFSLRPYINYQTKDSDDRENSAEAKTKTIGFSFNDSLDERTNYSFNYEYRAFRDEASKTSSDYFHRLGFNLGKEQNLFYRRLYYSLQPQMDVRSTKSDEDKDLNLTLGLNGQYDLSDNMVLRLGHNLQNTNSAKADQGYINNRSFLELDLSVSKEKNTHLLFRGERNLYNHEDSTQDYNETRVILKFLSNF
ncbi:MAG: hypothetical protein NC821_05600 [Candidatus Omnitrophica bacterium]|nr:hypothetical protein [Candidatus Omnitrophota bacterium]